MSDADQVFWFTASHLQVEVAGVGLPFPFVRELIILCAWENVWQSQCTLVMGINHNCDVRVGFPQMVQHGFQVVSLHVISIFGLCVGGADGTMHQKKGGVFPVDVFGTFVLPPFPDGRGRG